MQRQLITAFVFLGLVFSTGCDSNSETHFSDIRFKTDRVSYDRDAIVVATITNDSGTTIGFGACVDAIDGFSDGSWTPFQRFEICTAQFISLPNGKTHEFTISLEGISDADKYRLAYLISIGDDSSRITSNSFVVEDD